MSDKNKECSILNYIKNYFKEDNIKNYFKEDDIKKILMYLPIFLGTILLSLFIINDLLLNNKSLLTSEWMYVMLALMFYSTFTIVLKDHIKNKLSSDIFDSLLIEKFNRAIEGDLYDKIKEVSENKEIKEIKDGQKSIPFQILEYMSDGKGYLWKDLLKNDQINNGDKYDRTNFYILYGNTKFPKSNRKRIFGSEEALVSKELKKYFINKKGEEIINKKGEEIIDKMKKKLIK